MSMNPHIAEFEKFAEVYLSWAYLNFDCIVADVVKKHTPQPVVLHSFSVCRAGAGGTSTGGAGGAGGAGGSRSTARECAERGRGGVSIP